MENKDQYFQHDFNARNDLKIKALLKRHGAAAYSVFWSIVEELHQHNRFELKPWLIAGIAGDLYLEPENVQDIINTCIEFELFFKDGESIGCARVERNLQKRQEVKEKRSKAGKASALARQESTHVEQELTSVEQNPTKEIKIKEIKLKENESKSLADETPMLDFSFEVFKSKYPTASSGNKPGMSRAKLIYSESINGNRSRIFKALENYAKSEQAQGGFVVSADKFLKTDWKDWENVEPTEKNKRIVL